MARYLPIMLAVVVLTAAGCANSFTPATRAEVIRVEEKLDDTVGSMADAARRAKADGAEDGAAAIAGLEAGEAYVEEVVAVDPDSAPGWLNMLAGLLEAAGVTGAGMLLLNGYRNRSRKRDIAQSWEA
jgi:hypothetical protein